MPLDGWRELALGTLVRSRKGFQTGPFGSQLRAAEYVSEGIPVVMPKDLADGGVETSTIARVTEEKAAQLGRYRVRPGDLLLARRGRIGPCALVTGTEDGWVCGTGCLRLRLGPGVEPRYLLQYLRWPATVGWLEENAVGQTMPHLNSEILARLPVRLPPPKEQRRIAAALESIDETARSTRAVIGQLARVRDGLLRDLLWRGVRRTAVRPLVASAVGEIPRGFEVRTLGELAAFVNGQHFRAEEWTDDGLPIVRIRNLNGSRDFKWFGGLAKPSWIVEEGELLYAWSGKKGVSLGPYVWSGPRGVLNQHIFRVRPREGVSKGWLYETLRQATREIENKAHGFTTSLVHVRRADVLGYRVPVPPYEEQCAIAERAAAINAGEALERSTLERSRALKRGLMQELFAGPDPERPQGQASAG